MTTTYHSKKLQPGYIDPRLKKGDPPVCVVCKEPIPREEGEPHWQWMARKLCKNKDDHKMITCRSVWMSARHMEARATGVKRTLVPQVERCKQPKVERKPMSEVKRLLLEAEQRDLNLKIDREAEERRQHPFMYEYRMRGALI